LDSLDLTGKIVEVNIEEEVKQSYLDYAMSVIVGRALPDARDGLKPVHRRILYAMYDMGNDWNKPYKKSARIVGDVIGKYHPHGDQAVYDAIVRMAQDFSMRMPLIDGQGNFGSIDGDPPAAMRYTEVRMKQLASELLADIDKDTVDFVPNYDGSLKEPVVLPAKFPNLLVNGASGIAVGMATNIPTHNLRECIDATIFCIDNPNCTIEEIVKIMPGPDFPTSGIIYDNGEILNAYKTGRGTIKIRGKIEEEVLKGDRSALVITELPYQVNKAELVKKIAELARDKKLEGISDIRDESDKDGIRVVIELKRNVPGLIIKNQLFKYTQLEQSFGVNMIALVKGQPKLLNLKELIMVFIEHRKEVVTRRTLFELNDAKKRAHILEGLKIAIDNLDLTIRLIRESKSPKEAKIALMSNLSLSEEQAQAILDMKLQRLTNMEREKIIEDYEKIIKLIAELEEILKDEKKVYGIIKKELEEIKNKYDDKRRTVIEAKQVELEKEDLIPEEQVVVTITHRGFIKRTPVNEYKKQRRGGKGKIGLTLKEGDFIRDLFIASTHDFILAFTNLGRMYVSKTYEFPEADRASYGKIITNYFPLKENEKVINLISVSTFDIDKEIFFATEKGIVKKTALKLFKNVRKSGINAINIHEDDFLVCASIVGNDEDIILSTKNGKSIRFEVKQVRSMGRTASGVKGIELSEDDKVVSMDVITKDDESSLLTVTTLGYGKRTEIKEYRIQNRGGKGILTVKLTEKNGEVVGVLHVKDDDEILLISSSGKIVRLAVKNIPEYSRNSQGVKLIDLQSDEKIVSIGKLVEKEESGEEDENKEGDNGDESRLL